MKLRNFTLVLLMLVTIVTTVNAKSVDKATAEVTAKNCFYQHINKFEAPINFKSISIQNTTLLKVGETPVIYVIEFDGGGYVLVSAQEAEYPIIGYNTQLGSKFDINGAGPSYKYFIEDRMNSIEYIVKNNIPQDQATIDAWKTYSTEDYGSLLNTKDDVEVGPLLLSTWNQDYPYNYYAPLDPVGPGGRCYAGCVATAMAVVMHHFEWPHQGVGSSSYYASGYGIQNAYYGDSTYKWNAMPIDLKTSSPDESILASALIQYHAGVAVRMMFGNDGSGAYSADVPSALNTYFRYSGVTQALKQSYTTPNWEQLLKTQFDAGYPLYHHGQSSEGGHAWNCDGYRVVGSTTTFHHNFNWGGYQNGWFTSSNPNGYSSYQGVMLNFYPTSSDYPPYASGQTVMTTKIGRANDGSGPLHNYLQNTDASWLISPQNEFDSVASIDLTWEKFELTASDYVRIYDGGTTSDELIGEYSGTTIPDAFKSSGNQILITFHSSGSAPGFIFSYKSNYPKYCNTTTNINQASAEVYSNPENKYYVPSTLCRWNVVYSASEGGILTLHYVDTYNENDYVTVFDYDTEELHTFYGNVNDVDIELSKKGCLVVFVSDNMYTSGYGLHFSYRDNKLGIEDIKIGDINIYPNPAKDVLNVRIDSDEAQEVSLQITNIVGSVVYKESFSHNNVTNHSINVSSLKSGIYLITIKSDKGTETRKIVID
ncbi:MAG: C10 family peptidase [Bacteroidales bacterium]|jgi:hypothetical protein|nr:C10 family peptidase [Bacteroidales bacterium]